MKVKVWQFISCIVSIVGCAGLGIEIFAKNIENLKMLYIWGVITFIGIIGNAVFAFLNLKKDND